jgi:hypothetical protein
VQTLYLSQASAINNENNNKENNLGFLINVITNLHVLTVAIKAVGRVGKMIINSNLGTIGLNHLLSFFGLG